LLEAKFRKHKVSDMAHLDDARCYQHVLDCTDGF
jgi:hypothetical protein